MKTTTDEDEHSAQLGRAWLRIMHPDGFNGMPLAQACRLRRDAMRERIAFLRTGLTKRQRAKLDWMRTSWLHRSRDDETGLDPWPRGQRTKARQIRDQPFRPNRLKLEDEQQPETPA